MAESEIERIRLPFQSWQDIYLERKWLNELAIDGSSGNYDKSLYQKWGAKWFNLFKTASQVNYRSEVPKLECPVYFLVSKRDQIAHWKVAEDYYNKVQAPEKQLIWFYKSLHEIPSDEPKKFSEELIRLSIE